MVRYITFSGEETELLGRRLANDVLPGSIVSIVGELGAGKTTLVRGIISLVAPGNEISSPSYSIVNEYMSETKVYHFDLYRMENEFDFVSLDLENYFDNRSISLIEWGERLGCMPVSYRIVFDVLYSGEREITIYRGNKC